MEHHPGIEASLIDEVILGCANQAGEDERNIARMAALLAGLSEKEPGTTVNRLCGSGMDAVAIAARQIKAGEADVIVAGGAESMSRAALVMPEAETAFSYRAEIHDTTIGWRFVDPAMRERLGVGSMPETGENIAETFGISRAGQDGLAAHSQARAVAAQGSGRLVREIAPVWIPQRKGEPRVVDADEHVRASTTVESPSKLPTPVRANGTVTAGNASGVNDGAAALLIASTAALRRDGLVPMARVLGAATAGVAPRIMGVRPGARDGEAAGAPRLRGWRLRRRRTQRAFASQALAVLRALGLSDYADHVNPQWGHHRARPSPRRLGGQDYRHGRSGTLPFRKETGARHHVHRCRAGHRPGARTGMNEKDTQSIPRGEDPNRGEAGITGPAIPLF